MKRTLAIKTRRRFLSQLAGGAIVLSASGVFAEQLVLTPDQTEGPFYPDRLPLDTDNDLIIVNGKLNRSVGTITHLTGRVMDAKGDPVRNALVEIWQTDNNGIYRHTKAPDTEKVDANFQSFGRFLTGSNGEYYFRTIKPVMYGVGDIVRAPHIHVAINVKGKRELTTQCYIKGEARNETDLVLKNIKKPALREAVIIPFTPLEGSAIGELQTRFDIVLGHTPEQA